MWNYAYGHGPGPATLGAKVGGTTILRSCGRRLLAGEWRMWSLVRRQLDADEAKKNDLLHCGTAQAAPGCGVTIRYLYQVLRGLPHEAVFAQILLGLSG